jgi:hypothetical protein
MSTTTRFGSLRAFALALLTTMSATALAGCAAEQEPSADEAEDSFGPDQIVGANSVGKRVTVQGHVLVPVNSSQDTITAAVRSQMRVLFGAARSMNIALSERQPIINTASFVRETVTVVDPANPSARPRTMWRVSFTYRARAVVPRDIADQGRVPTATLFQSYSRYAADIIRDCQPADTQQLGAGTIWYHFNPGLSTCSAAIQSELDRIESDRRELTDPDHQVTVSETQRRFIPVALDLSPLESNEEAYPEYDRLFADNRFVAYSFFGLDNGNDPWDYGGRNYFSYLRAMMAGQSGLHVTNVSGGVDLLAVSWRGVPVTGVTYERVFQWVLEGRNYPANVSATDVNAFRLQVLRQWRDHYVTLGMTSRLTMNGTTRDVPIEIRTYYGDEEGAAAAAAVRRYRAAFADADVFQYSGHSHLGAGPLDPANFRSSDFPNRYQIAMVNSCVSFNYYNQFFRMHPGGTANLDTISNGIEVYLEGLGLSSARFMLSMIDGHFANYHEILESMRLDLPWATSYDPNRVADGELDNRFDPARTPLALVNP